MSEDNWIYDAPDVADNEELLRRIPWVPEHVGFDAQTGEWYPTVAAFRRGKAGEGMSVHRLLVVERFAKSVRSVYDIDEAGTVSFPAHAPREVGGGVIAIQASDEDEPDAVLRRAHAEVRPPTFDVNRRDWSLIRDTIIRACRWVVAPDRKPAARIR